MSSIGLENVTENMDKPSFGVPIDLVSTLICQHAVFKSNAKYSPQLCDHLAVATFNSVIDMLQNKDSIDLDTIQK